MSSQRWWDVNSMVSTNNGQWCENEILRKGAQFEVANREQRVNPSKLLLVRKAQCKVFIFENGWLATDFQKKEEIKSFWQMLPKWNSHPVPKDQQLRFFQVKNIFMLTKKRKSRLNKRGTLKTFDLHYNFNRILNSWK